MIQKLAKLHSRLRSLRRRRRLVRWSTGSLAMVVALLWALIALFLADWLFRMDRPQRVLGMAICAGAVVWAWRRYTLPWLGQSETDLDMALMVEKQRHIDSDVVAAIQFESPEAPQWGSVALEQAVIENTATLGERLDVTEGIPKGPLRRRFVALVLTAIVVGLAVWMFPDYAAIFLNRLLLGARHYPTRTRIEIVTVNGHELDLSGWGARQVKVPYGRPVRFEVTCTGDLPAAGDVSMKTIRGGLAANVALEPFAPNPQLAESQIFAGEIPRLMESARCEIHVGDASTDPAELLVVSLPVADVQLEVAPPSYAADKETGGLSPLGMRQIVVLEGSQVTLRVLSDKRLTRAQLTIEEQEDRLDLVRDDDRPEKDDRDRWKLEPAKTPLERVTEPIRYSVQVTDADNLELERPLQGVIRIKVDQPPRVTAAMVTRFVLPTAKPSIRCLASDDFGLAQLSIVPQVIHADGRTEDRDEIVLFSLPKGQTPQRSIEKGYHVDLAPLKLVKGDQLKISVRATDYRGEEPGKSSSSEPLVCQVTDEAGILAAISEADKESARQLRIMIERQIDVGGGR